jgi:cell division cycle 2-like
MTDKGKSRWAEDEEESAATIAQRKREKEEKKRAKAEKWRKAETQQANGQPHTIDPVVDGDSERPSKRIRTDNETEQASDRPTAEPTLLTFPTRRFGACRNVEEYDRLNDIEEGSYGLVSRAREKATGTVVALKKLKMDYTNDGFPVTGLREIQTLKASQHPHIVHLREVVMGATLKE